MSDVADAAPPSAPKLPAVEGLKHDSRHLRGRLTEELADGGI